MYTFLLSESRRLGTYKPITVDGKSSALIVCPGCGMRMQLKTHTVSADGVVTPSVVCRICNFHDYILLSDWSGSHDRLL